jgi:hypothetical protein
MARNVASLSLRAAGAGDVGDYRDQPDDFAIPPLGLIAAMCELRVGRLVRQLDLEVELDRLAGEALAEEGLNGRPGFTAGIGLPITCSGVRPSRSA